MAVLVKEDWTIISEDDVDHEKGCLKSGKDYLKGDTGWLLASYHDSCWRSAIHDILFSYWYEKKELLPAERLNFPDFIHGRGKKECHWDKEKIVQSPFPKMPEK